MSASSAASFLGLGGPRRAWVLRLAVSALAAAGILSLVARHIDLVPPDLSIPPATLAAFLASLALYFLLRAGRWYFLVRPLGPVTWGRATLVALAGILWVVLLPLRLGEFARPYLLARHSPIRMEASLATVAVERVVDGLVVCALFFSVLGTEPPPGILGAVYRNAIVVMGLFTAALLALFAMARWPGASEAVLRGSIGRVLPGAAATLGRLASGISEGLATLPSLRPLAWFLAVTLAYWAVNVGGVWILARGLGLPLSFAQAGAVVAVVNVALLIPAGPAMAGNFQAGMALGLAFFLPPTLVQGPGAVLVFWTYVLQVAGTLICGALAQLALARVTRNLPQVSDAPCR